MYVTVRLNHKYIMMLTTNLSWLSVSKCRLLALLTDTFAFELATWGTPPTASPVLSLPSSLPSLCALKLANELAISVCPGRGLSVASVHVSVLHFVQLLQLCAFRRVDLYGGYNYSTNLSNMPVRQCVSSETCIILD